MCNDRPLDDARFANLALFSRIHRVLWSPSLPHVSCDRLRPFAETGAPWPLLVFLSGTTIHLTLSRWRLSLSVLHRHHLIYQFISEIFIYLTICMKYLTFGIDRVP